MTAPGASASAESMLRRWEVEWELRELHPFRQHLCDQRRTLRHVRRRVRVAFGVLLGVTLAATFFAMRAAEQPMPGGASPQAAMWGGTHRRPLVRLDASDTFARSEPSAYWVPRYDPGSQFGRQFPRRPARDDR